MARARTATDFDDPTDGVVLGTRLPTLAEAGYEELEEGRGVGLIRRFFTTLRHLAGLLLGALVDHVRSRRAGAQHGGARRGLGFRLLQLLALLARPWIRRSLRNQPFPVQLRRRLELLGPTYIKLGQILSLREDLLPRPVTEELKNLLDRLPAVPFERFMELVADGLGRPVDEMFVWIEPLPAGSASIAQSHRATIVDGDQVILKVVKPGIRETLQRDARLLGFFGRFLQVFLARFQPQRVIREFTDYTLREADLVLEADNSETFAANFSDQPDIRFPRIYRRYSSSTVLCMEFFDGPRPDTAEAQELSAADKNRVIDLGVEAITRMLYRDGFFHADLHPGNLILLPGPQAGFIDLGMVGRLDEDLRRTLLYYYYCLVTGDPSNAARYLANVAEQGPGGDLEGFRREVEEVSRRWQRAANFADFSLARLILESVGLGGRYRVYFPVELVLMTKALVTFEAVGHALVPGFDVAAVSKRHMQRIILRRFSPLRLAQESLRGVPELIDAVVKGPLLISEGLRLLEQTTRRPRENPFAGVRGTIFGGFCMVAGAILLASAGAPVPGLEPAEVLVRWGLPASLFLAGILAALNKRD